MGGPIWVFGRCENYCEGSFFGFQNVKINSVADPALSGTYEQPW